MVQQSSYKLPISIDGLQFFHSDFPFQLECGEVLPELTIGYHTFGKLNEEGTNVIWVCHALTANSDVSDWWSELFGVGKILDPNQYFIVCANILGSCYGTTCARSISPKTDQAYSIDFPLVTMRDIVKSHDLLRKELNIKEIALCIGGSCGGHQVLEFAHLQPDLIKRMALLVTAARESAWVIATHEAQRLAIEADETWQKDYDEAGAKGLKAARGIGLLGYRTFQSYVNRQTDENDKLENLRASSYISYQGEKLVKRFYAQCYYFLTKSLDTHHLGRGRESIESVLENLQMPAFILSIDSDNLIPPSEQQILADFLPNNEHHLITSDFGHDGFLIEAPTINKLILKWMKK